MRSLVSMWLVLTVALCASTAQADSITHVSVALEADDAVVLVESDVALGTPRVHLDAGAVRLWFPGLTQRHFIERRADGGALRRVTARPGAADTSLVVLDLGDTRRLAPNDVRVALDGTRAIVRIARAVLPPGAASSPPHAAQHVVARSAELALAAIDPGAAPVVAAPPATVPIAARVPEAPGAPTPTAAPTVAVGAAPAATATAPLAAAVSSARADAPRPPSRTGGFAGGIPDAKTAGMRTVGLLAILLFGLALFGRWLKRKRATRPAAAIHVVASHRLGAKHQLVVVRAFDQEILLSINGGETRRIASRRAGVEPDVVPMNGTATPSCPGAEASGRLLALVPAALPEDERAASRRGASRGAPAESSSPFGAELARLVRGIAPAAPAARPLLSDSVSGLVRLREARGRR